MRLPGTERTLRRLVDEHYDSLYRFAYRLSGSSNDADDLTQEAFCKAQVNLGQLRDVSRARCWLFQILRNLYVQKMRAAKRRACLSLDELGEPPVWTGELPAEVDSQQLQSVLNALPEAFRTPLILYYFDDFSYRDIADQLGVPIGTVMSRLARAKAFLRQRWSLVTSSRSPDRSGG